MVVVWLKEAGFDSWKQPLYKVRVRLHTIDVSPNPRKREPCLLGFTFSVVERRIRGMVSDSGISKKKCCNNAS